MVKHESFSAPELQQIKSAARMFGVSRSFMQWLVTQELVESFLVRRNSVSRQGIRLVKISSVRAFFDKQASQYARDKATGELVPVAARGREVMAQNRAKRRAQKQVAKGLI